MAKKDKTGAGSQERGKQEHGESILVETAKAIGGIAGKVAAAVGAAHAGSGPAAETPQPKRGKLAPKNKSRLPRREKKTQKKAANRGTPAPL